LSGRPSTPPKGRKARRLDTGTRKLADKQIEALTVAMVIAPGVYARNRMFDLFTTAGARRARARAAVVRGIILQLGRATSLVMERKESGSVVLRYAIPAMGLTRVVELSPPELGALRLAAERANVRVLPSEEGDKELVTEALARLMDGDAPLDIARIARDEIHVAEGRTLADSSASAREAPPVELATRSHPASPGSSAPPAE
jgi:hypothetical protein